MDTLISFFSSNTKLVNLFLVKYKNEIGLYEKIK